MNKRDNWMTRIILAMLIGMLAVATTVASESPLTQPKADGLIGEQADGYIGLVTNDVPADIRRLVNSVNAKRKAGYEQIAAKQGVPLSEVEKVGAKTAFEKTVRGNYVRDTNGTWRKK